MRQAGRYLPEYNRTRSRAGDFLTLCKTPELVAEVTLQPLARFPLDAAILFSDILTIPDAMGLGLYFSEGEGPKFTRPIRHEQDVAQLHVPDPETELRYVMDGVRATKQALADSVPLIGFAGSPFTLACYMIEGASGSDFMRTKTMLYDRPELLHQILERNTAAVAAYLRAQIAAGVDAIMIFDTWGGVLSGEAYRDFSLSYITRVIGELNAENVPSIVFTKGGSAWLPEIAASGCHGVGLDWMTNIHHARKQIGGQVALQGNLDPAVLLASPKVIHAEVAKILAAYGEGEGHIFNLGHGISQFTPPEHAAEMVAAVHELSQSYHAQSSSYTHVG